MNKDKEIKGIKEIQIEKERLEKLNDNFNQNLEKLRQEKKEIIQRTSKTPDKLNSNNTPINYHFANPNFIPKFISNEIKEYLISSRNKSTLDPSDSKISSKKYKPTEILNSNIFRNSKNKINQKISSNGFLIRQKINKEINELNEIKKDNKLHFNLLNNYDKLEKIYNKNKLKIDPKNAYLDFNEKKVHLKNIIQHGTNIQTERKDFIKYQINENNYIEKNETNRSKTPLNNLILDNPSSRNKIYSSNRNLLENDIFDMNKKISQIRNILDRKLDFLENQPKFSTIDEREKFRENFNKQSFSKKVNTEVSDNKTNNFQSYLNEITYLNNKLKQNKISPSEIVTNKVPTQKSNSTKKEKIDKEFILNRMNYIKRLSEVENKIKNNKNETTLKTNFKCSLSNIKKSRNKSSSGNLNSSQSNNQKERSKSGRNINININYINNTIDVNNGSRTASINNSNTNDNNSLNKLKYKKINVKEIDRNSKSPIIKEHTNIFVRPFSVIHGNKKDEVKPIIKKDSTDLYKFNFKTSRNLNTTGNYLYNNTIIKNETFTNANDDKNFLNKKNDSIIKINNTKNSEMKNIFSPGSNRNKADSIKKVLSTSPSKKKKSYV